MTLLLLVSPWLLLLVFVPLLLWPRGPRVRACGPPPADQAPMVSVIVPARNESLNISTCVASLMNSIYARREIIVVDDDSTDGTGDIVRILAEHADGGLHIVAGEPLPPGWLGKPWACWQGYQHARGELLLFTDADTRHDDTLLGHAVGALRSRKADLVSVMPRQLLGSFWERLVLPQIFTLIAMRYPDLYRVNRASDPRDVIANGQFLLVTREAYEAVGGHEALRDVVVEDQNLAQRLVSAGRRIFVAHADELIETRMYRSLRDIISGWTKNLALGARAAVPEFVRPLVPWLIAAFALLVWVVPPVILLASVFTRIAPDLFYWSMLATALSMLFWLAVYVRARVSPLYAMLFGLGAVLVALLFVRSVVRGGRIEWKGRWYDVGQN